MFFYGESDSPRKFVHCKVVDFRENTKPVRRYKKKSPEPASFSPSECNQVRKKPIEKVLDTSRYSKENEGGERQNVDHTHCDEEVNLEMGGDASKIASKIKNKGSSRKNLKSKKKKEKQRTEDEEEVSQPSSPEKIWVYEPKEIDEYVNLDKNENVLQQVEAGIAVNDIPELDVVHIYNEDPDFSLKNAEQSGSNEKPNLYEDEITHLDACQTNDGDASSPVLSIDHQSLVICPDSLNVKNDDLVFEIPVDYDRYLIGNQGIDTDNDINSKARTENDVQPNSRPYDDKEDESIHEDSPSVDHEGVAPKKCLWYDYSKDGKTSSTIEDEDLSRPYDTIQTESRSGEDTDTDVSFEDEGRGPIRRSKSYGPSESSNDIDLNNLIESIMENNNEVIESMKANDFSNADKNEKETKTKNLIENNAEQAVINKEHVEEQLEVDAGEYDNVSTESTSGELLEYMYNLIPVNTHCDDGIEGKGEDDTFDMLPELIVTQASIESVESDSGVEHTEFLSKMDAISLEEEEDEEEGDSGTELRYDDFLTNDCSSTDSDYNKWVENIKPLLYDAELVANLYIRLANKYAKYSTKNEEETHLQHLHSAQIAYDVIKESNLTNFASVITYLLSYLGAIKSEKPVPENISVPNLLSFLEEIIKRNTMTSNHVTMFTCFISRPNRNLTDYHELRLRFLHTCFKQEVSQLNVNTEELRYLRTCFIKISEYFVQLDMKLTNNLTNEYLLPHITDQNSTSFIMDTLTYMGLVRSEEPVVTTNDITSALILLDIIFLSKQMSLLTSQKLYAFIQLNNPRFRFCTTERDAVTKTLRKAIDF